MTNQLPYRQRTFNPTVRSGTANLTTGAAGALEAHDVTFPTPFATVPVVIVNPVVADPAQYQVCAVAVTTTGFQIKLRRGASGTAAFPVTWIAATS